VKRQARYIPESELESVHAFELGDLSVKDLLKSTTQFTPTWRYGDLDFGGNDVEELGKGSLSFGRRAEIPLPTWKGPGPKLSLVWVWEISHEDGERV
jgi:hypothetical protein